MNDLGSFNNTVTFLFPYRSYNNTSKDKASLQAECPFWSGELPYR